MEKAEEEVKMTKELLKKTEDNVKKTEDIVKKTEDIIKKTEDIVLMKDKELLMAKGLMSSRGIFERQVGRCYYELKQLGVLSSNERLNISNLVLKLDSPSFEYSDDATITTAFMKAVVDCNSNLRDLYDDVSKEQHGYPWTGDSIRIFTKFLKPAHECIIEYIAKEMNLDVVKINE